jgi:aldehyde dehydrogenase (NAD+)
VSADLVRAGLFVDGEERPALSGKVFPVFSPDSDAVVGEAARAGDEDVDVAVRAARAAFPKWANLAPRDRERMLLRAADAIERRAQAFVDLIIDEGGGTITKARGEVAYAAELFRAAAGEARRLYGDTFPNDVATRVSLVMREPLGVVAVVSPFNAPLSLLVKMVAFTLAAGNTVVVKPSEETPLVAVALVRALAGEGWPPGVINVVTGFGTECGEALAKHLHIDGIAFTGSTTVGVHLAQIAAARMRRVQLELGGKNSLVVASDFDPELAAKIALAGAFVHAGQICMASARILVERPIMDGFVGAFARAAAQLHLGELRDERTFYGPLINDAAVRKVEGHVRCAIDAGAELVTGGEVVRGKRVFAPTILREPPRHAAVWREETFGPVTCVAAVDDLDEAVTLANDSEYGLSAAILSRDVAKSLTFARRVRAGSVHVGMHTFQSNALAPIGGYGLSGVGRSGGKFTIEAFTELKWISVELGTAPFAS